MERGVIIANEKLTRPEITHVLDFPVSCRLQSVVICLIVHLLDFHSQGCTYDWGFLALGYARVV